MNKIEKIVYEKKKSKIGYVGNRLLIGPIQPRRKNEKKLQTTVPKIVVVAIKKEYCPTVTE